jgi:hypothetical protein
MCCKEATLIKEHGQPLGTTEHHSQISMLQVGSLNDQFSQ